MQLASLTGSLRALRQQTLALDQLGAHDLPDTFGGSVREVGLLARKLVSAHGPYAVLLVSVQCRGCAQADAREQALFPDRATVRYRSYCWTNEDIERYVAYRQGDTAALLEDVNDDLLGELQAAEQELLEYLRELGMTPFVPASASPRAGTQEGLRRLLGQGSRMMASARVLWRRLGERRARELARASEEQARHTARQDAFACYDAFKTALGLLRW